MDVNKSTSFRRGLLQLPSAPSQHKLLAFAAREVIESVALARDHQILFVCAKGKMLRANKGVRSLATIFGISPAGLSVMPMTFPDNWLQEHWEEEDPGNMENFLFHSGPLVQPDSLRAIKAATKGKQGAALRNIYISQHTIQESIAKGVITHEQASRVQDGKDLIHVAEEERHPDMLQPLRWTFRHWREPMEGGEAAPTGDYPDRDITFVPRPDNLLTRRKHYWIYSGASGFGKTHFVTHMRDNYNASTVGDKNNLMGVSEASQFLMFDETAALPELQTLKSLTSGNTTLAMNKKTYGRSFAPRQDVQVIIMCNVSPYESYGTYCPKMQRRYIDMHTREQLEARFFVIKLDGDVAEDRLKYSDPVSWTKEEAGAAAADAFYDACSELNELGELNVRSVKRALYTGMKINERRAGTRLTTVRSFMRFLITYIRPCDVALVKYAIDGIHESDDMTRFNGADMRLVRLGPDNSHLHDPIPGPAHAPNYFPR